MRNFLRLLNILEKNNLCHELSLSLTVTSCCVHQDFPSFFSTENYKRKRDVWVGCQNEGERPFLNFRFIRWKVFKLKATKNERKKSLFCGLEWPRFFLQWQRLLGAQFHLSSCVQRQLKFKKRNKNFFHVCFFLFPMWNIVTMNANMHICDGNIRFI